MVLTSKDNYAVYVKPKSECYLYIYQVDAYQKAYRVFPNKEYTKENNPVKPAQEYWLPDNKEFLFLDENPGIERIYIFATHLPAPDLENIREGKFADVQNSIRTMGIGGKRGLDVVRKVNGARGNAMELINRKLISNGDFYYSVSFIHK